MLNTPLIYSPDEEIVYDGRYRYTYRTLNERINRLAGGLKKLGVGKGDIVAVFDYDSHRYLECFFAFPMMGAVLESAAIGVPDQKWGERPLMLVTLKPE